MKVKVIMDCFPKREPRGRPNARITFVDLNKDAIGEGMFDLKD
jgi:hypothetical protein